MAQTALKPRDIASEYGDIYENTAKRYGVQNAKIDRKVNQSLTSRPTEDGRSGRIAPRRYQGPSEVIDFAEEKNRREQLLAQRYYTDNQEQIAATANTNTAPAGKVKIRTSVLARARGFTFAAFISSIAFFIWPFQFFIACVTAVFLGMSSLTETSWTAWIADKIVENAAWVTGFEYTDLGAMTYVGLYILGIIAFFLLFGALLAAKFMRLNPLFGNGSVKKTTFFMIALCSCIVPIFPFTAIWAWSVMIHPK